MKTLLKEGYKLSPQKSSGKIVMTRVAASRLYDRFVQGIPTLYEQQMFEWVPSWSFGRFYDANHLELIDEHNSGRRDKGV